MESVIGRLLSDFESGKLTRRQLVQTLALVAVGSPVASALAQSAAQNPQPAAAPWKTVWLDHISYAVSDHKRSADFYAGLMGWEIRRQNETQTNLNINGLGDIIIRNSRRPGTGNAASQPPGAAAPTPPDSTRAAGGEQRRPRPPLTGVINHISWGVQPWDTDAVKAELVKRGLDPRPDMVGENFKSWHVFDPDGWDLQISNQTKESRSSGS